MHGAVLRAAGFGLGSRDRDAVDRAADRLCGSDLAGAARVRGTWERWPRRGCRVNSGRRRSGCSSAAAFAGLVGAVVAIPCLRMRDLYLALGTMAFALVVEQNVLGQIPGFATDSKAFSRWSPVQSDKAYFVMIAATFVLLAWLVIALRRGEFGRRLQAMKDSPTACTTLGLDLTRTKVRGVRAGRGDRRGRGIPHGGMEGHRRQGRLQRAHRTAVGVAGAAPRRRRRGHGGVGRVDRRAVVGLDAAGRPPTTRRSTT